MPDNPVFLFPGLGAYSAGVLRQAKNSYPEVAATFAEIDAVAAGLGVPPVSRILFDGEPRSIRQLSTVPDEVVQLAIFGVSVTVHRILTARGVLPRLLVGHSFGEIAALVSAGVFSLADGVKIVCARAAVLRPWEHQGGMAAVNLDEETAGHVAGVLDEPDLVVACVNAPRQTVLAGPLAALERAERLAGALDVLFARLHLPYASHHPAMRPAVADFVARLADVRQQPLRCAVHSPVHGRRYTDDDDLKQALAECLVLPVRFTDTVRALHAKGYTSFVEAGALNALTKCVEQTVPNVRTVAPLANPHEEDAGLRAVADPTVPVPVPAARNGQPRPTAPVGGAAPAEAQVVGVVDAAPAPVAPVAVPPAVVAPVAAAPVVPTPAAPDRQGVLTDLRELYATTLEYPTDLLVEDAHLEAELGVDSLKQTSLLSKVIERFGLSERLDEVPVWDLPTLGCIADYVTANAAR